MLTAAICLLFTACQPGGPASSAPPAGDGIPSGADAGALGSYQVAILSARLVKDSDKQPAVVVKMKFENKGDQPKTFDLAVAPILSQDSVMLDPVYVLAEGEFDRESATQPVEPGATAEIEKAYSLISEAPVEITVRERFEPDGQALAKSFAYDQLEKS